MKKLLSSYRIALFILAANWLALALDGFESRKRFGMVVCATVFYLIDLLLDWKKKGDLIPILGMIFIVLVYLLYLIIITLIKIKGHASMSLDFSLFRLVLLNDTLKNDLSKYLRWGTAITGSSPIK